MSRAYIKLESSYQTSIVDEPRDKRAKIRIGRHFIPMPGTRRQRRLLGAGLCTGGVLGFLPVVGFWMLPLGLVVLSLDSPRVRRLRRQLKVRWARRKTQALQPKEKRAGSEPGPKALGNGGVSSREDGGIMAA